MNTLYILPGWEDTGNEAGYQKLSKVAREKEYEVIITPIDWTKPLSAQVFSIKNESVLFGFSLGAILAWLIAQQQSSKHLVLASMTPHYSFTDMEIRTALVDLAGEQFVNDIIDNLRTEHLAERQTVLYGDQEGEAADIVVRDTDHELTDNYISELAKLL